MFEFLCRKRIRGLEEQLQELRDTNVYYQATKLYMTKKHILLDLHRQNKDSHIQKQLIFEINVLAELIDEDKINEEDISGTLTVYPANTRP